MVDCVLVSCFLIMVGYLNKDNCFMMVVCLVGICWFLVGVFLIDGCFVEDSLKCFLVL